ncbi:serine/threonine-protein phosphatase 6 regulatory ankyrin repeat subunit A-like isoform X1 [Histomonas meleagridis]|uniref:serine/threonine-protein phosphatase 6 regulatory ankyrin repeat subunit A-like isoform X1 n=1 Tax=Histomonas meleagridis TaxID=135588 RepID=UPI003559DF42|nr:serine/threonine-protein phosphatase 6 regulatory ankyrin repeat subunit A-like isoform X1 [Histomonas meleagridis]KAH0804143.1 serine/threonine-protein phosphatase 6 regulatory ankyrin repeat subunit A-like isoform X1 [Histomonas meleagridis]
MNTNILKVFELKGANLIPELGASVLHLWGTKDDIEPLKDVVVAAGKGALLLADFDGNTILHYAAISSALKISAFMVEQFPQDHFQNINKITPAHIAAQQGNVDLLAIYQNSTTLLTDLSSNGWSPLHFAIYYGQIEAVRFLLENKINSVDDLILGAESTIPFLNHRRLRFVSPYDLALIAGQKEIAALLETYDALPSLHSAVSKRDLLAITYLVESPFSPFKDKIDLQAGRSKYTPLHIAALRGYYDICHYLIQSNASLTVVDSNGLSPLELAVTSKSVQTIATISEFSSEEQNTNALFLAADLGKKEFAFELIKSKISTSAISEDGDSILIRLIKRNLLDVASKFLIQCQPDVNIKDPFGATALHYACVTDKFDFVKDIIGLFKLDLNEKDNLGLTPLMYLILSGNTQSIPELNKTNNDIACDCGLTPFIIDYAFGITSLLTPTKNTPQERYTINFKKVIELVEKHKLPKKTIKLSNEDFVTPTINLINPEVEKVLMKFKNFGDYEVSNITILHMEAFGVSGKFIEVTIKSFRELIEEKDSLGRIPIHYAVIASNLQACEIFSKEMGKLNHRDKFGNTIFHFLSDDTMLSMAKRFYKASEFTLTEVNNDGQNPFHTICKSGAVEILKFFLQTIDIENRSALNAIDKFGKTPLDYAIENKNIECIHLLHSMGIENKLNTFVTNNNIEELKKFIDLGYPINSSDKSGMTPLHYATVSSNIEMIKYLLSKGADVHANNSQSMMPIHYAAKMNDFEVIKALLTTKHRLNELKDSNQPYLLSTDSTCKLFLFQYWKRELLYKNLMNLMQNRIQSITELQIFCNSCKTFSFNDINNFAHRIIFIQTTLSKIDFNFSTSLHHFLQIFNTLDLTTYVNKLKVDFNKIVDNTIGKEFFAHNKLENQTKIVVVINLLMMFYPLLWVIDVSFYIKELCKHSIESIDDMKMIKIIQDNIEKQETLAINTFNELSPEVNKNIIQLLELPQIIHSQLNNGIIYIGIARISGIHSNLNYIFQSQFNHTFKRIFNDNYYSFPRSIPFQNKQNLIVIATRSYIIMFSNDKPEVFITIPIPMIWTYQKGMSYKLMSPVGRFDLRFKNDNSLVLGSLVTAIKTSTIGYNVGQSHFQKKKDRLFQCLICYASSLKNAHIKLLVVKAGDKEECDDICKEHLRETVNTPILLTTVIPFDITDSIEDLVII